ncbi:DUF4252 domain-containing protein [Algoriphagus sediminis]|uniref:DUF4252 domain-containing protein n=1 Tax=Algoriphagus sediminis TaxID=3057113 RepID=A0ABT7YFF9_9BACT|nr:DUF4252 domain-containing protein [Algoriphagus sediminis]MDN3204929.1 DUF4252 domain-containing protein [Algoriphagus sediminis]
MKKLILTLALFGAVFAAQAQSKTVKAVYEKYKGEEDFFHMDIGGNFMNFAEGLKIDIDEDDMATVAKSIEHLTFFSLPDEMGQNHRAEYKAIKKGLDKERYDLIMETEDKDSGISVYSKGNNNISDLVVLVTDDDGSLMIFELEGTFDREVVSKATAYANK